LSLVHETPLAGHLGIDKTYHKVSNHFYLLRLRKDVEQFFKTCHTWENLPPVALLTPIPAMEESLSYIIVDCVGPLPKMCTGNKYLLTILCTSTGK